MLLLQLLRLLAIVSACCCLVFAIAMAVAIAIAISIDAAILVPWLVRMLLLLLGLACSGLAIDGCRHCDLGRESRARL